MEGQLLSRPTLPAAKMLPYYAARFPTVEINYTFYRMPNEKLVASWAAQTPSPYKLTLKAPRRITHDSRLKNCGELVAAFCRWPATLGDKLGALLFQLPPNVKKDLRAVRRVSRRSSAARLRRVRVPPPVLVRRRGVRRGSQRGISRLCVADSEKLSTPVEMTADYAYFRLRDEGYTPDDIERWADTIARADPRLPRRVRLLQTRGGREGPGIRAAADAPHWRGIGQFGRR